MITKSDLTILYNWAKDITFPLKKAPTVVGYSNKDIYISWLKGVGKRVTIRKKLMTDEVYKIFENEDILYATYSTFAAGTILKPHKDPNVYREKYRRIQIPLRIPDKNKCYMEWMDIKDGKFSWNEGEYKVCDVMNHLHQAFNYSDKSMDFLMVDIKEDSQIVD